MSAEDEMRRRWFDRQMEVKTERPDLNGRGGGGTSGPMDPWQQSVESRLSSLDARLGKIEPNVSDIKTDVAVLKATVATKTDLTSLGDKLTTRMQVYLALVAALIVIATAITKFL